MEKQPNSRFCFLCGVENEHGLQLSWYNDYEKNQVHTELVIPDHFNGYPGIAHGGIVAALLDETSFRAGMLKDGDDFMVGQFYLTASMKVRYRRPTPTGKPLLVVGWLESSGSARFRVAAEIRLPDGTVTASCEALLVAAPEEYAQIFAPDGDQESWEVYPE